MIMSITCWIIRVKVIYVDVQGLEEIVDTIGKNNINDEVEDDIIPLVPVTRKETYITSKTLQNL